jgi:hypothetical protein
MLKPKTNVAYHNTTVLPYNIEFFNKVSCLLLGVAMHKPKTNVAYHNTTYYITPLDNKRKR